MCEILSSTVSLSTEWVEGNFRSFFIIPERAFLIQSLFFGMTSLLSFMKGCTRGGIASFEKD